MKLRVTTEIELDGERKIQEQKQGRIINPGDEVIITDNGGNGHLPKNGLYVYTTSDILPGLATKDSGQFVFVKQILILSINIDGQGQGSGNEHLKDFQIATASHMVFGDFFQPGIFAFRATEPMTPWGPIGNGLFGYSIPTNRKAESVLVESEEGGRYHKEKLPNLQYSYLRIKLL